MIACEAQKAKWTGIYLSVTPGTERFFIRFRNGKIQHFLICEFDVNLWAREGEEQRVLAQSGGITFSFLCRNEFRSFCGVEATREINQTREREKSDRKASHTT
jgi:hypothetical protein